MKLVTTKNGKIEGIQEEGYSVFKGIPYAKAPIGELRWKAPQPLDNWDGVLKADCFKAKSMQEVHEDPFYDKEFYDDPSFSVNISEDSLYLNIWTPADKAEEKLPVAFWIHGGAFMGGYGSEKEFDGEALCKKGVILVTINYRVNIFGFLAHPWLSAENEKGISGNYGTLDQLMALKWVYDNIENFGGDKENITVFGQSAGAMSVAVFGRMAFHYYKSGLGSGGLVNTRYVVSILDALKEEKDIILEEDLLNLYEKWIKKHPYDEGEGWGRVPWSQAEMPVDDVVLNVAKNADAALIIIGRTAGEDQDNRNVQGSYLLTDIEKEMIANVSKAFERTIVILNVGNIIDIRLKCLENRKYY